MFIKLEIESKKPVVYQTELLEFFVGSGDGSHLVINENSVSKKHLRIYFQAGQWFIADQDSTNGTYLNGQRLVPWVKAEFNFYDNVTLGAHVNLVYMENSENYDVLDVSSVPQGFDNPEHNKTKVISIEEFKTSQVKAEQKRSKELQYQKVRKAREKNQEYNRFVTTIIACFTVIILGLVSNKIYQARKSKLRKETIIKKIQARLAADEEIDSEILGFRIYRGSLLKKNFLLSLKPKKKCIQVETVPFCQKGTPLKEVLSHEKAIIFFLEEKEWIQKAKLLVENHKMEKKILNKIAILQVLDRYFRRFKDLEENDIYLTFFSEDEQGMISLSFVGAIKGENLDYIFYGFKESSIQGARAAKKTAIALDPFFTTY